MLVLSAKQTKKGVKVDILDKNILKLRDLSLKYDKKYLNEVKTKANFDNLFQGLL